MRNHDRMGVEASENMDERLRIRLIVFARFCVARIVREIPGAEGWEVSYDDRGALTIATVRARLGRRLVEGHGTHADPAIAIWNAMCRVEQPLRDTRCLSIA